MDNDILKILLDLYSTTNVRDQWPPAKGEDFDRLTTRVVDTENESDILDFCSESFYKTKQHVYLFPYKHKLPTTPLLNNTFFFDKTSIRHFYIVDLTVKTYLFDDDQPSTTIRHLPWPIVIEKINDVLCIRFVIMEQNLGGSNSGRFTTSKKASDEADIVRDICRSLSLPAGLDLNKGIKALWKNDEVDVLRAQWKKPSSTAIETMDENFLIKAKDPDLYKSIIKTPIFKSLFVATQSLTSHVNRFACDPTLGVLYFTRYCRGTENTDNVIRQILQHN